MGIKLKHEWAIYTWGGFYNKEFKKLHKQKPGARWFNSFEEREEYIATLRAIEIMHDAKHLMMVLADGYNTRTPVVCHRVIEYSGKRYYSQDEQLLGQTYSEAEYWMQYKWYPGFNDYPLGENFDYDLHREEIKIVQEWITGSFDINKTD